MGFRLNIPLPGPFSYSARIGGRRRPAPSSGIGCLVLLALLAIGAIASFVTKPSFWTGVLALFLIVFFMLPIAAAVLGGIAKLRAARSARTPVPPITVENEEWLRSQSPEIRADYERQVEEGFAKQLRGVAPGMRPHLERAHQQWRDQLGRL